MDKLEDHSTQINKSPYAYAWNNPIKLNDPDGNCPCAIPFILPTLAAAAEALVASVTILTAAKTVENVIEQIKATDDTKTKIPNPNGSKRKADHQADVNTLEKRLLQRIQVWK